MSEGLDPEQQTALEESLESFFESAGMEAEADVVALVLAAESDEPGGDKLAGIPAASLVSLAPLVVEWFLALVRGFAEQLQTEVIEESSKSLLAKLKSWIGGRERRRKKPLRRVDVSKRLEVIADIARTLEEAGWPRDQVEAAADELWRRGEAAARKAVRVSV